MRRAVAFDEISSKLLKARNLADGQQRSERRIMTAQVMKRAVAPKETNFHILLIKNWYEQVLPPPNIKINKGDCF